MSHTFYIPYRNLEHHKRSQKFSECYFLQFKFNKIKMDPPYQKKGRKEGRKGRKKEEKEGGREGGWEGGKERKAIKETSRI